MVVNIECKFGGRCCLGPLQAPLAWKRESPHDHFFEIPSTKPIHILQLPTTHPARFTCLMDSRHMHVGNKIFSSLLSEELQKSKLIPHRLFWTVANSSTKGYRSQQRDGLKMKGLCSGACPQLPTSYALCLADSRFLQSIGKVFSRHWKATRQSRSSAGKSFCCSGSLLVWRLINSHLSWGERACHDCPPPETIRTRRGRKEWGAWKYSVIQIIFYKFILDCADWTEILQIVKEERCHVTHSSLSSGQHDCCHAASLSFKAKRHLPCWNGFKYIYILKHDNSFKQWCTLHINNDRRQSYCAVPIESAVERFQHL